MCRRAFLTYRFHFRSNLKLLMTNALTDTTLPELAGLEQFMNALAPREIDKLFYEPMTQMVLSEQPESVLDYGSGDGWLTERLSKQGIICTGFDIDAAMISRCREYSSDVEYGGAELLHDLIVNSTKFDIVVCSRGAVYHQRSQGVGCTSV